MEGELAAVVLAAGRGERFGGGKLTAPFRGRPLIDHALDIARASPARRRILVAPAGLAADAPDFERVAPAGALLSDSLKAGIAAAAGCAGAFVFLGDMPLVPPDLAARLVGEIDGAAAAFPTLGGVVGHPVLLAASAFPLVDDLAGDRGLGAVLNARKDVVRLPLEDGGILADVDYRSDLAALDRNQA